MTFVMTFVLDALGVREVVPMRFAGTIDHDGWLARYVNACRKKSHPAKGFSRFTLKHGAGTISKAAFDRPYLGPPMALTSPFGAGLLALEAGERVSITRNQIPPRPRGPAATGSRA
jgi:hypothetical protein